MNLNKHLKNALVLFSILFVVTACSTSKKGANLLDGDVYTGSDTIEYLAAGVADRAFFATNKSDLTTASRSTLRKQADYLRKNKDLNVVLEGHADERGTREYNLALGQRRAEAVRDYLTLNGINKKRINVKSFGEEKPLVNGSDERSWARNRRAEIS